MPDPAWPLRRAPRPDPPVVCPGFGFDRSPVCTDMLTYALLWCAYVSLHCYAPACTGLRMNVSICQHRHALAAVAVAAAPAATGPCEHKNIYWITPMHTYAPVCTEVRPCASMNTIAILCTDMRAHPSTDILWYALICTSMHALVCTAMHCFALLCTSMHWYALICTDMHRCALLQTATSAMHC